MKRTLRHPIRGDRVYAKPKRPQRQPVSWRAQARQPRMRPRKTVHVSSIVGSPEEEESRPNLRLYVVGVAVLILFGVLVLRLWSLQVINGKTFAAAVTRNEVRVAGIPAPRGEIVDRNDTVLVTNAQQQEILLSHQEAAQNPRIIGMVAALVGETPQQVEAALNSKKFGPYEPVPVAVGVSSATVQYLQTHQSSYPGVTVQTVTQRTYPQGGTTGTHILGYTGAASPSFLAAHSKEAYAPGSQVGVSGIEAQYEQYLRGADGNQELAVNAQGDVVGTLKSTPPQTGDTVVLNVDAGLQEEVQNVLAQQIAIVRKTPDKTAGGILPPAPDGAAVVMNPQNGQVLALASFPTYDLNEWVGGISTANFAALQASGAENDNVIEGLYAPGSTFKLITATAALQAGLINTTQTYNDAGSFTIPDCVASANSPCTYSDAPGDAGGTYNVSQALTVSSDSFFYNLGTEFWDERGTYGDTPIQNEGTAYGEGTITGIDLPGEVQGRIDSLQTRTTLHKEAPKVFAAPFWSTGSNLEMAFGQGGNVLTPIEQAQAYATFANGGTRYAPQLASEVVDPITGKVVKQFQPRVTGHVTISPTNYAAMLKGFEGAVQSPSGTAYADFTGFPTAWNLAGKTGTADSSPGQEPDSWFVAFGPNPNPQYVVLAVVAQGGYGAQVAAPIVRHIYDYLYSNPVNAVKTPTAASPPSLTAPASSQPFGEAPPPPPPPPAQTPGPAPAPAPASPATKG